MRGFAGVAAVGLRALTSLRAAAIVPEDDLTTMRMTNPCLDDMHDERTHAPPLAHVVPTCTHTAAREILAS